MTPPAISLDMSDARRSAEQLCDEAQARQRAGQIDDARILYERAVAADPDHYRTAFLLGHLHAAGERVDDAAVCARNAYRIYPCASSREFVIDATARRAFFNASRGATAAVVADFDFLLSIAANEPAAALYEFLKDQYRDDPDVAAGVASSLTRQHRRDLLADWGDLPKAPFDFATHTLWLNLTSRCNLRCTYCTVGKPGHVDADIPADSLDKILDFIAQRKPARVNFGCYTETTSYPEWTRVVETVLATGASVNVISNMARLLRPEEIDVLSRCDTLQTSIDTFDIEGLKILRKNADIRTIVYNIVRIRARALEGGRAAPEISWICVPTSDNLRELPNYVACAIACGIDGIDINPVLQFNDAKEKLPDLLDLPDDQLAAIHARFRVASDIADRHGLRLSLPHRDRIEARLAAGGDAPNDDAPTRIGMQAALGRVSFLAKPLAPGMTRLCTNPWDTVVLSERGELYPCTICGTPIAKLGDFAGLDEALTSAPFEQWRLELLRGTPGEACTNCLRAPETTLDALAAAVAALPRR